MKRDRGSLSVGRILSILILMAIWMVCTIAILKMDIPDIWKWFLLS